MRVPPSRVFTSVSALLAAATLTACIDLGGSWSKTEVPCVSSGREQWFAWPDRVVMAPIDDVPLRAWALEETCSYQDVWKGRYCYCGLISNPVPIDGTGTISLEDDQGSPVAGTTTVANWVQLEFRPAAQLKSGVTYTARLSGARTRKGTRGDLSWKFSRWVPAAVDPTFGNGGMAVLRGMRPHGLAMPPGGGVLVAGDQPGGVSCLHGVAAVRVDGAGKLDPGFGAGGLVLLDGPTLGLPACTVSARALAVDAAGRSLLASSDTATSGPNWAVARLDLSGALDPTFGSGGVVRGAPLPHAYSVTSLRSSPSGEVIAGYWTGAQQPAPASGLVRLLAGGALDGGFGTGGLLSPQGHLIALEPLADGGLVVATTSPDCAARLDRFDSTGAPDASFGVGGSICLAGWTSGFAVVGDSSGRLVAAGAQQSAPGCAVLRLTANGQPDPTFAAGAAAVLPFSCMFASVALAQDGRVAVAANLFVAWLSATGVIERTERPPPLGYGPWQGGIGFDPAGQLHLLVWWESPPEWLVDSMVLRLQ
jgi:uncharacterized delta-60 repeat protein